MTIKYKGFTLIELLVVIAIIGILAAMVTVSFTSSQRQARDTQRKSDLAQYRTSLENYANTSSGGLYLVRATAVTLSGLCSTLGIEGNCPEDPSNGTTGNTYRYISDAGGTKYVVWGTLENIASTYWVVCSTGQSGKAPTSTNISGGTCPTLTP